MCFGGWTKVVGFGWTQAAVFDGLIHLTLCWLTRGLILRITQTPAIWLANLLPIVMLPAGIAGRPDELAMSLAIGAILISSSRTTLKATVFAGIFWGLCLASSLSAFVGIGVVQLVWLWSSLESLVPSQRWNRLAIVAGAVLLVQCVVWAPILMVDPRAMHQMLQHAVDAEVAKSLWRDFAWHWRFVKYAIAPTAAIFIGVLIVLPWMLIQHNWTRVCSLAAFLASLLILSSSHNSVYLWMIFPVGVPVLWQSIESLRGRSKWVLSTAACGLICFGLFIPSAFTGVNTVALAIMPSTQSMAVNAKILRDLIPAGSNVLLREHWYSLAATCRTVDSGFCGIADVRRADYLVFTGNGSAVPGQRWKLAPALEAEVAEHFEVIFSDLPTGVPMLFGHRLTNSSRGFGVEVYRRKGSPSATPRETSLPATRNSTTSSGSAS